MAGETINYFKCAVQGHIQEFKWFLNYKKIVQYPKNPNQFHKITKNILKIYL